MPFWVEAIKDTPIAFGVGHNGDGVRLADLDGDGLDDYVWLAPNAAVTLFLNGGRSEDGLHWIWRPASTGKEVASGAGASREQIILADMDGDGKDDLCIVDAKTGGLTLYINLGAKPNGWGWGLQGSVATGIGGPGKNVRLADIDGDGKADYILLGPNGEAHLYLNKGEKPGGWNWEPYRPGKPFAKGIGSKADLVQFKDIDGDGKADYIGIGQLDGSATVYKNLGTKPDGWGWAPMNDGRPVATGVGTAGADVLWGRMEKNGRYSYLALSRSSGSLRAWLNGCSDLSPASNGSSGGSSGSSGSSSGSSGSGDDPGQYLQGGLPIPIAGLGGLGLATSGISAIALLTPYAITAQNALTSANGALQPLSSPSPTSGAVSQAVQALTIASGGQSPLHPSPSFCHIDFY
ncbi:MAG: hypothetical protein Q9199_002836 [Rusavskia elegans]